VGGGRSLVVNLKGLRAKMNLLAVNREPWSTLTLTLREPVRARDSQ
jgi:hypothetical protein